MWRGSAIVFLVLWGSATGSLRAQTITGTVSDAEGRPLAGAAVTLFAEDRTAVLDSVRAGRAGAFELAAPGAGRYIVLVHLDGWASVPSETIALATGERRELALRIPLIGVKAAEQIGDRIRDDPDLQRALPEICGEELRPWEAGLVVGMVRERRTRAAVAGARVWVIGEDGETLRSTVSNEKGTYVLCNVPLGSAIRLRAEARNGMAESLEVKVRPGMVSWYDFFLR